MSRSNMATAFGAFSTNESRRPARLKSTSLRMAWLRSLSPIRLARLETSKRAPRAVGFVAGELGGCRERRRPRGAAASDLDLSRALRMGNPDRQVIAIDQCVRATF